MNSKLTKYLFLITCVVIILFLGAYVYQQQDNQYTMTYNEFVAATSEGRATKAVFHGNQGFITVFLEGSDISHKIPNPDSEAFLSFLLSNNVEIEYQDNTSNPLFAQLLFFLTLGGVFFFFQTKKTGGFTIKNVNKKEPDAISFMLNDIAGNAEAKAMVEDIIQFIKNPEKYTDIGAKMPRGVLFYGPPGTGKTLMAKAIAGEAGVPFYPMSGSDFVQMYVGVGASRIRDLFKTAKKAEKAVIFIDEIDAIGKRRSRQPGGANDERDQTLNALLTEMSGFHERDGIIVIAATNRLDTLDDALLRPGRFDRLVEIGLPDVNARQRILELHARKKKLADTINMTELSKSTVSFSGAMLEHLLNEAAIFAANDNQNVIKPNHIDKAFYTVIAGAEKLDTSYITPLERKITAYHEAGHALMTHLLLPDSYISRVTIIPSTNGSGGFSFSIPKDTMYMTKQKILANIKVLLAGRASEEVIFGADDVTTGASNDIEKASSLIMDFINKYGMEPTFGLFNYNMLESPPLSDLVELCRSRLNALYEETKQELEQNLSKLQQIAEALLEKETLKGNDIEAICI